MTGAGEGDRPLLLDTHAWIWWVAGSSEMPLPLRGRIQDAYAARRVWASAISAWEVALLVQRGRLSLRPPPA